MKLNQNLVRKLGNFEIIQRTKDGFFNSTSLLKQWNESAGMKKQMIHFSGLKTTNELIETIQNKENLKQRDNVILQTRGKLGGTWMHPILFIDFAMWINPRFRYDVIKFVYDNLIRYRIEGADSYKRMNIALDNWMQRNYKKRPEQKDYIRLASLIKSKVGVQDWNKSSTKQAHRRKEIEQVYEFAFDNNLNKKETQRMIKFQLTKKIL